MVTENITTQFPLYLGQKHQRYKALKRLKMFYIIVSYDTNEIEDIIYG